MLVRWLCQPVLPALRVPAPPSKTFTMLGCETGNLNVVTLRPRAAEPRCLGQVSPSSMLSTTFTHSIALEKSILRAVYVFGPPASAYTFAAAIQQEI